MFVRITVFDYHFLLLCFTSLSGKHATSLGFEERSCKRCEAATRCWRCRKHSWSICSFVSLHLVMLRHFFAVFSQKSTSLHEASMQGYADVVKMLLDAGAAVNARTHFVRLCRYTWLLFSLLCIFSITRRFSWLRGKVMRTLWKCYKMPALPCNCIRKIDRERLYFTLHTS